MSRPQPRQHRPDGRDDGQITAFVVVMAAALVLLIGLVLDGGLTLAARERALGEAQEAARAGAQGINLAAYRQNGSLILSPAKALADARAYLASISANGTASVAGNVVTVTVTIVQPMQILSAAGLSAVTVHATASAVPERGITGILP
jgi:Putative Flp pilus-assembly TadE/G-like